MSEVRAETPKTHSVRNLVGINTGGGRAIKVCRRCWNPQFEAEELSGCQNCKVKIPEAFLG